MAASEPPGFLLRTLGCRLNQAESEEIQTALSSRGFPDSDNPDVVVVNTCTVTAEASRASRKLIRRTIGEFPNARVVVTGCYAVAEPAAVASIPGVDLVVSNKDKEQLADRVAGETTGGPLPSRIPSPAGMPRANLKVQTGCDERCAFCIVPRTRGPLLSRREEEVVEAAALMAQRGTREVVLTGAHLGKYGWDRSGSAELSQLIEKLCAIPDLTRVRLSSIEASQIDDPLLGVLADQPKVCRHLHMPLQTGDERIWEAMERPGTLRHFLQTVAHARRLIPGIALTTDVMVGFPGEGEGAFVNTMRVVEEVGFQKLHVFRFSPRSGTPAARAGGPVDAATKRERSQRLRRLGDSLRAEWLRGHVGSTVWVLVEEAGRAGPPRRGVPRLGGLTDTYLRVYTSGPGGLVGREVEVLVTSAGKDCVEGELVGGLPVLQDRRGFDSF